MPWSRPTYLGEYPWIALLIAAAVAAGLTWLAILYARKQQLVDYPDQQRRSHAVATPRGGGISIAVVLIAAMLWLFARMYSDVIFMPFWVSTLIGVTSVTFIGWIDYHRSLSVKIRFAVHLIAAGLLSYAIWKLGGSLSTVFLTFLLAIGLINIWNFMVGINGLAASQAALVCIGYALFLQTPTFIFLALVLAAACLGFLPFNFPKAMVFMGDVGSGCLGYGIAIIVSFALLERGQPFHLASFLLICLPLTVFCFDAGFTLLSRILTRQSWWQPHVQHVYQRMSRKYAKHWPVTLMYGAVTIISCQLMLMLTNVEFHVIIYACVMWYLGAALAWKVLQKVSA